MYWTLSLPFLVTCGVISIIVKLMSFFKADTINPWDHKKVHWFTRLILGGINDFAASWHGYEVHGKEKVVGENCLLVGYHSRASMDLPYLMAYLDAVIIVTDMLFMIPGIKHIFPLVGFRSSKGRKGFQKIDKDTNFMQLLTVEQKPLLLVPGGAFEFAKSTAEMHQLMWPENPGFARVLAKFPSELGTHTKVVPFYTKNCEKIFWSTTSWRDYSGRRMREIFDGFRKKKGSILSPWMCLLMLFAPGMILLPSPIKLDTYLGDPIQMQEGETSEEFGKRVGAAVQKLVNESEALPERSYPGTKPSIFWYIGVGIFTFIQNFFIHGSNLLIITLLYPFARILTPVVQLFRNPHKDEHGNEGMEQSRRISVDDTKKHK